MAVEGARLVTWRHLSIRVRVVRVACGAWRVADGCDWTALPPPSRAMRKGTASADSDMVRLSAFSS
jgi:hypothetical protein